jgi:hypothetical protein
MLPVLLCQIGSFPVWFLPANLLAGPLVYLAVGSLFLGLACLWWQPLAQSVLLLADWVLWLLQITASWFTQLPYAVLTLPEPLSPTVATLLGLLLFAGFSAIPPKPRIPTPLAEWTQG